MLDAAFTASPAPRVRSAKLNVRAQASASEDAADLTRRAILSSSVALGAAAMLPMAAPLSAAANTVLSGDWEQVRMLYCHATALHVASVPADAVLAASGPASCSTTTSTISQIAA